MIADSIKHITLYRGMQPYLDTAIDFLLKTDLRPRFRQCHGGRFA